MVHRPRDEGAQRPSRISRQHLMTPSTPTGVLVLAMLVGQVTAFARVPKDGVEKGGELLGSRMSRAGTLGVCTGPDDAEWKDPFGDGCDWYAEHDFSEALNGRIVGCSRYIDYGQWEHCPVLCNRFEGLHRTGAACVQTFLCGAGTTMGRNGKCEPDRSVCGAGTVWRSGKCEGAPHRSSDIIGHFEHGDKLELHDGLDDDDTVSIDDDAHNVVGLYDRVHARPLPLSPRRYGLYRRLPCWAAVLS